MSGNGGSALMGFVTAAGAKLAFVSAQLSVVVICQAFFMGMVGASGGMLVHWIVKKVSQQLKKKFLNNNNNQDEKKK